MTHTEWTTTGLAVAGDYAIERGPWRIVPTTTDGRRQYALYLGHELHGLFPDAHEAAVHADLTEAEVAADLA